MSAWLVASFGECGENFKSILTVIFLQRHNDEREVRSLVAALGGDDVRIRGLKMTAEKLPGEKYKPHKSGQLF